MCDLNTASIHKLLTLEGVSYAQALAIQLWRPYGAWGEVATIPDFDSIKVEALRAAGAVLSPVIPPLAPHPFHA
jgi:DNA uptake protein ComE-like DNA-binding protein